MTPEQTKTAITGIQGGISTLDMELKELQRKLEYLKTAATNAENALSEIEKASEKVE